MVVTEWHYHEPFEAGNDAKLSSDTSLDVMRKRAYGKKGIACRISCVFTLAGQTILECAGEHSYVIDLEDQVDKNELRKMFRNTFQQFKEKFDLRKLGTVLRDTNLKELDEFMIDYDSILPMLI